MEVLVDTSVWIDYFRSGDNSSKLEYLIDENLLVINDIILAELLPLLTIRKENEVISLLKIIKNNTPVYSIDKHFGFMCKAKLGIKQYA